VTPRVRRLRFLGLILALEAALWISIRTADLRGFWGDAAPLPPERPPPAAPSEVPYTPMPDPFVTVRRLEVESASALGGWEEKIFRGRSVYETVSEEGFAFLRASSRASSSGLFLKLNVPVEPGLHLAWRWRAREFPRKPRPEALADRRQDDFAARIYVVFPGSGLFGSDVIEYIWDESLPAGTVASSPFSQKVKLFVIRSGRNEAGSWRFEERDIERDYRELFGRRPKRPIGAVALMSDSDNTGTVSAADFADLVLKRRRPADGPDPAPNDQPKGADHGTHTMVR